MLVHPRASISVALLLPLVLLVLVLPPRAAAAVLLGELTDERAHSLSGTVYAVDRRTLRIDNLTYDGRGPDAVFWLDRQRFATPDGIAALDKSSCRTLTPLPPFDGDRVFVYLPLDLTRVAYFSVWSSAVAVSYGGVAIDPDLIADVPQAEPRCTRAARPPRNVKVRLGKLSDLANHGVAGVVYALNSRTLLIEGFTYDGRGPPAVYWIDERTRPTAAGVRALNAQNCLARRIPEFTEQDVLVELPEGRRLDSVRHFSIWGQAVQASFGGVTIDPNKVRNLPEVEPKCANEGAEKEVRIGRLSDTSGHDVRGTVFALNSRTLRVKNFRYDGLAPDARFWVGRRIPDRRGSIPFLREGCVVREKLPAFSGAVVDLELPNALELSEIDYLSLWSELDQRDLGSVSIDASNLDGVPKAGESSCSFSDEAEGESEPFPVRPKYNCEELNKDYQVRWAVVGNKLNVELVGRIRDAHFMGFGPSGRNDKTDMIGSDLAIAYQEGNDFFAVDYFVSGRNPCSEGKGVCADESGLPPGGNDISKVSGGKKGDLTMIRYTRPLKGNDKEFDRPIRLTGPTFVLWAMGPLNPSLKRPIFDREQTSLPSSNVAVEFGRIVTNACERRLKVSENTVGSSIPGFKRPTISGVTDITARIGPSGGARGVEGITGGPSRGFAWYISPTGTSGMDVLIPAIGVERGRTYTFTVQGGTDDGSGNVFHPLYITTDSVGGFQTKSPQERRKETVYAGIQEVKTEADGAIIEFNAPAAGALCRITSTVSDTATVRFWADYHDTLDTSCTEDDAVTSNSGKLRWTVPADAPDLLYYQSVTLPFIGYKIGVFDEGEVDKGVLEEINGGGPLEIREEVVEESPSEGENEEEAVPTMEGNVDDGPLDALPRPSPQSNADDEPAATSESDATPTSEGEGPDAEGDVDGTVSEEDNDCQVNFKGTVRSYTLCKKDTERKGMDVYWNLREEDSELETLFRARKVEGGGYVAFGWGEVEMLNSHVVIANTNTESGIIDSYFLADSNSEGVNANSSLPLLSKDVDVKGDFVSGIFTRKLDIEGVSTLTSGATSIIWAIGPEPRPPNILEKHNLTGTDILEISGSAGSPGSVGDGNTTVADGNSNCSVSFNDTDKVFEGCRKGLTHNVEVYWTIREEDGEIDTLFRSQTDGYIGFGWGSSKMIGANAVIAMQDEKGDLKIEDYGMKAYSTAGVQPENNQELIDKRVAFDGEYLAGMFTRRLAVEGLPVITKGETDAIWAVGVRPSSKAQLKEHSKKSRGRINLAQSSGGVLGVDTSTYFIVHGVLMTMAWFVLTPSALVIMRFLKAHNPSTFRWHRALNLLSVSFVVAAFIMGLVRGTRKHRAHLIIGGIVFSLATLQALSGLLRPGKDKDGRQLWAFVHFLSGYVTLGLGVANVWVGLGVIGAATGYYIVCGVLVGFYVIAQLVFGLQAEKYPVRECEAEEAFPPDVDPLLAGEAPGPDLT